MKALGLVFLLVVGIAGCSLPRQRGSFPAGDDLAAARPRPSAPAVPQQPTLPPEELGTVAAGTSGLMPRLGYSANLGENVYEGCLGSADGAFTLTQTPSNVRLHLEGNGATLEPNVGRWVKVAGHVQSAEAGRGTVIAVDQIQETADLCAANPTNMQPAYGKTGNQGTEVAVTTAGTAGRVTPPVQTPNARASRPGEQLNYAGQPVKATAVPPPPVGAPSNVEQTAQTPFDAERLSTAATRAEPGGIAGQTLGVQPRPSTAQGTPQR